MTADPNLPLLEEAASKLRPFLDEVVFVGGVTLGLLIGQRRGFDSSNNRCGRYR
jgi:hypothetical protein